MEKVVVWTGGGLRWQQADQILDVFEVPVTGLADEVKRKGQGGDDGSAKVRSLTS